MANLEKEDYQNFETVKEILGTEELLEEFIKALPNDTVIETLEFIAHNHDINL